MQLPVFQYQRLHGFGRYEMCQKLKYTMYHKLTSETTGTILLCGMAQVDRGKKTQY